MKDSQQEKNDLSEYIESGRYFEDAKAWYEQQYILPFTERSWLFIFCIVAGSFFMLAAYNAYHLLPLEEEIPYILQVKDADSQYVSIAPLLKKEEDAWVAVAAYLVKEYVTTWENYRFSEYREEKLLERKQRVRKNSTKNVYQEYVALINDSNPRSPIRLYRNEAEREINIKDVMFTRLDESSGKVDINFTATVNQLKSRQILTSDWRAEIYFQLPAIDPESQKGAPLGFLVTSYKVTSAQ